jgi:NitT/TauT family transport system substrate-binding protein
VADLKGKSVAYAEGSVSQFYLGVLLKEAGLSLKDVETMNMTAGDAGRRSSPSGSTPRSPGSRG